MQEKELKKICDKAKESCPVFPGEVEYIHWSFEDPAAATGTDEEKLEAFRKIRDQIQAKILAFIEQ